MEIVKFNDNTLVTWCKFRSPYKNVKVLFKVLPGSKKKIFILSLT